MDEQRYAQQLRMTPEPRARLSIYPPSNAVQGSSTPYQVSSESYTLEGRDSSVIAALRSFGRLLNNISVGSTTYMKRIKDIRAGSFFDVVCRV